MIDFAYTFEKPVLIKYRFQFPILISELWHKGNERRCLSDVTVSSKEISDQISRLSLTKGSDTFMALCMSFGLRFPKSANLPPYLWSSASKKHFATASIFNVKILFNPGCFKRFDKRRNINHLKGRVSRFSACASDDLSTVKIIVFRPIRSALTTLAGYGGKLLQLVVDSIRNDRPSTTAASC